MCRLGPLGFWLQLDFDGGAPPEQAWRRKLNSHANRLKEFSITFMEAMRMVWMPPGFASLCSFGVLRRPLNLLVLAAKFCSRNVKISDDPWPQTVVLCPGGGVAWKGNIS